MKATTFHTKITKFMEDNGFDTESGWDGRSSFSLSLPGKLPFLIDIVTFEDEDEIIQVRIYEVDGNHVDSLESECFATLKEVQEFISNYFSL